MLHAGTLADLHYARPGSRGFFTGVYLNTKLLYRSPDQLQKLLPVGVVAKDGLALITTGGDVVVGSVVFNP